MAQYFVLSDGARWQIRHKEKTFPYSSEATAMKAAMDVAQKAGDLGHPAEVLVQQDDGQFRVVWTYQHAPAASAVFAAEEEARQNPHARLGATLID